MNIESLLIPIVVAAACYGGGYFHGREDGGNAVQVEWDAEKRNQTEMALATEREIRRAVDAVTVKTQKEKLNAKTVIDRLRADVRSGAERLSVAVGSCPPAGDASFRNQQARAELLPEVADRIVGIAADADQAVRDLNECIDTYNAARDARVAN